MSIPLPWQTDEHLIWLEKQDEPLQTSDGKVVTVYKLNHKEDELILSSWAKHFRNHYCLDEQIDFLKRGYGFSRKDYLTTIKFPDPLNNPGPGIRSGDFGEILFADYLQYILNYWVPRTRYSDKDIRNESSKGSDIIGFKFTAGKESPSDSLMIIESKAKLTGSKNENILQKAVDHSGKDYTRKAESLNAIKQRLLDKNRIDEAVSIERFQGQAEQPYKEINGAALLILSSILDDSILCQTETKSHPNYDNLELIVIHGEDISDLIKKLYDRAANEA